MVKKISVFLNGIDQTSDFSVVCQDVSSGGQNEPLIFAADGGLNLVLSRQIAFEKMVWVGDRDSVNSLAHDFLMEKQGDSSVEQVLLNPQKDHSDFAVILDKIRAEYGDEVVFLEIFGGLGGRGDHEIANVEEAKWFVSQLPKGGLCFFQGGILVANVPVRILGAKSKWISLFSTDSVEILGCAYSGTFRFQRPSHGLSNFVEKDVVEIKPSGMVLVCVSQHFS